MPSSITRDIMVRNFHLVGWCSRRSERDDKEEIEKLPSLENVCGDKCTTNATYHWSLECTARGLVEKAEYGKSWLRNLRNFFPFFFLVFAVPKFAALFSASSVLWWPKHRHHCTNHWLEHISSWLIDATHTRRATERRSKQSQPFRTGMWSLTETWPKVRTTWFPRGIAFQYMLWQV